MAHNDPAPPASVGARWPAHGDAEGAREKADAAVAAVLAQPPRTPVGRGLRFVSEAWPVPLGAGVAVGAAIAAGRLALAQVSGDAVLAAGVALGAAVLSWRALRTARRRSGL